MKSEPEMWEIFMELSLENQEDLLSLARQCHASQTEAMQEENPGVIREENGLQ